jgi:adenosyl cobinamide kinase/adenosyl cobinamide phosphate guanylyltransferase
MKDVTDFKVGDLVIHKGAGREMWMILGVQWVVDSTSPRTRAERELILMDCVTNQTKISLARFYCKFLAP